MYSRVQITWSDHSVRMSWWSVAAADNAFDSCACAVGEAPASDAISSVPTTSDATMTRFMVCSFSQTAVTDDATTQSGHAVISRRALRTLGVPAGSLEAAPTPASVRRASVNAAIAIATSRTAMSKYLPVATRLRAMPM